jgi:hypothetical protein
MSNGSGGSGKSQEKEYISLAERTAQHANVECPHCTRKFNQKAADRHIPVCNMRGKQVGPPIAPKKVERSPIRSPMKANSLNKSQT